MIGRNCFKVLGLLCLVLPFTGCANTQVGTIQISPASQSLTAGQTVQFTATGNIGHGSHPSSSTNVTNLVTWSSSTTSVATVTSSGLATAVGAGTTTISATMAGSTGGTATLTVTPSSGSTGGEPLVSMAIVPAAQTLTAANQTAGLIAIGTTSGGTTVNLTNMPATIGSATIKAAVWSSSVTSVATINAATGVATALANGTTTITAVASNPDGTVVTGTATVTVNIPGSPEPLASLAIVPGAQTLTAANQTAGLIAIGTTTNGTTVNLTNMPATIGSATIKAVTWSSSVTSVATINAATGVATALANGTTVITAIAYNPDGTVVTGIATLTVNIPGSPEPLASLAIVPGAQTLTAANQTAGLIAIGTTTNGTTVNLTNMPATIGSATIKAATWSSSVPSVATVNAATGVATALSNGTTVITAITYNPDGTVVTGIATLTVNISSTGEPLVSLTIVPGSQVLTAAGQPAQFIAIGTTASGATVNLTNKTATIGTATISAAAWSSSSTPVATIDRATGLATSGTSGVTAITAMASNPDGTVVTGTAALAVNITTSLEPLVSLAIVPAAQQALAINQNAHFIAIGTTSAGTTVNLTNQTATVGSSIIPAASWISTSPAVASIDPATGVATALSSGSTAIVATAMNPDGTVVTGTAAFTVTIPNAPEPLVSMAVVPASQALTVLGQTANLTALATTGTGTTVNLTNQTATIGLSTIAPAVWSSSNPGVASVDPGTGVVTALTAGTAAITAIASNPDHTVVTGISTVTVTGTGALGAIASIAVLPGSQAVQSPTDTAQFLAIGTTTTGVTTDLTQQVAWSSSSAQVATIGAATGLATAVGQGSATMTALYTPPGNGNVVTGTATFTVVGGTTEQYTAVTITPSSLSLSASGAQTGQLIALGAVGTNGLQVDVTNSPQIKWSSSIPTIASISSSGLATGLGVGSTNITAELTNPDGTVVSATATVTVTSTPSPEPLLSLTIIPSTITVGNLLDSGNFIAIGTFSTLPQVRDLTNSVNWISSEPNDFPVNTNSTPANPGAPAGLVTAYASGSAVIIAEATDPATGSIQTATATFSCPYLLAAPPQPSSCTEPSELLLATVTVYNEGLNTTNWLITASSATGTPDVIHCGPGSTGAGFGGSVCVATYPISTSATVVITAPAQTGVAFGGWSSNCTPSNSTGVPIPAPGPYWTAAGPNYCVLDPTTSSETVGAIFN